MGARTWRRQIGQGHGVERVADGVADLDPQEVHVAEAGAAADAGVVGSSDAQTMGAIGPSRARSTSPIRISAGGAELVAAVGAARAVDEARLAQADHELLEVRPRQRLVVGHLGQADRTRAVVAGELHHQPHAVLAARREMHGATAGKDRAASSRVEPVLRFNYR